MDIVSATASYCAQFLKSKGPEVYRRIIENCRDVGRDALKRDYYIPPTLERVAYRQYDGAGTIAINRTQQEFCVRGRRMDAIIRRTRARSVPDLHLAVLVDNSDQMTAWARSLMLGQNIPEERAPLTLAKIATIALFEEIRDAQTRSLIAFGSKVDTYDSIDYRRLLAENGSGCCRLDLALSELLRTRWDLRRGERQLVILTSMPPDTGTGILLDDIGVQEASLISMRRMARNGVRILYLPIFTQMELVDTKIGVCSSRNFAQRIHKLGIAVSLIGRNDTFVHAMRVGIKQMLQRAV